MAKKGKPLSHGRLASLGAEKLAEILIEAAPKDEALDGRLRREISARDADGDLPGPIRR